MNIFAVFGNPIKHSKSADIYSFFANEMGISDGYDLKLVLENDFNAMLHDFFDSGGVGANITVPFKERAVGLCHKLTERALIANSVNTIKKRYDGTLLGDNTDGIGFINDLKRLRWFNQNDNFASNNVRTLLFNNNSESILKNVLLIGAGGAAKGIIPVLLNVQGCYINIVNRTFLNAKKLVQYYHKIGRQNISYIDLNYLSHEFSKKKYDLIINATSSSMYNDIPKIPSFLITQTTKCYDLFYQKEDTVFIKWCKRHGSHYCSDGLGMLVEQAACSFYIWHNKFPSTTLALNYLKSMF